MVHFLVVMLSRPRSGRGLNGDDTVVGPLGGGQCNRLGRVLGVAAGVVIGLLLCPWASPMSAEDDLLDLAI
jgi:hypothetical protein